MRLMRGMEKISEAILDKVKVEAQDIIKDAEARARQRIEEAQKQQEAKFRQEKDRILKQAREEATRIMAQASIKARQELLVAKTAGIDEIISKAKEALSGFSGDKSFLLQLIKEAIDALNINKVRICVSHKDIGSVRKFLDGDKQLAKKVEEINEVDCSGGAIVEDIEGKLRIDNTYETRLELLLPRLLPEINQELFYDL